MVVGGRKVIVFVREDRMAALKAVGLWNGILLLGNRFVELVIMDSLNVADPEGHGITRKGIKVNFIYFIVF